MRAAAYRRGGTGAAAFSASRSARVRSRATRGSYDDSSSPAGLVGGSSGWGLGSMLCCVSRIVRCVLVFVLVLVATPARADADSYGRLERLGGDTWTVSGTLDNVKPP